jgi:hypothetical protein
VARVVAARWVASRLLAVKPAGEKLGLESRVGSTVEG